MKVLEKCLGWKMVVLVS